MLCPVCAVDLVMSERQGIEIDYCPSCRGVWLDRGELDKIIGRSADTNHDPDIYHGGKKHPYRGMNHHDRADLPPKPKRGHDPYHGGKKYPYRGMNHHETEYRDNRNYEDRSKAYRKKSRKKQAKNFLEEIFDIFD